MSKLDDILFQFPDDYAEMSWPELLEKYKAQLQSQIEIEKLRARIDEMHKYAQRGTDSEIPYFNQRLTDLTEKLKELENK